jgi:hypothetical protein
MGGDNHFGFDKKISWWKRKCGRSVVVMQQLVLLSPKFGAKTSHIFTQLQQNVRVVRVCPARMNYV